MPSCSRCARLAGHAVCNFGTGESSGCADLIKSLRPILKWPNQLRALLTLNFTGKEDEEKTRHLRTFLL